MTRVAVLKPDHGPLGGFERVVNRVEEILVGAGHSVTRHTVDLTAPLGADAATDTMRDLVASQREFLTYLRGRDRFDGLATGAYDLVISTSPPSHVHRHRAHLALFYHHHRIFYDLQDLYVAAGFAADPDVHAHAAELVRNLDRDRLAAVTTFATPSATVARRLAQFNDRESTMPFEAGIGVAAHAGSGGDPGEAGVLCVTRHEFPKRAELVVAAAHLIDERIRVRCTGTGGRLAFARALDVALGRGDDATTDLAARNPTALWCNTGAVDADAPSRGPGRVEFTGHLNDADLDAAYAAARCVVAPAYDEDYGLTAIEAMAHGRPVVVCDDGGGLAELVTDGATGLVVEPTPAAIADAVERLHADPELARDLGSNGRARAAELTWQRAGDQLLDAVEATLDRAA